jgi:hypothetical protein
MIKKMETEAEFKNILLLEKAVVFIFFEWSGQAHISKSVLCKAFLNSKFRYLN